MWLRFYDLLITSGLREIWKIVHFTNTFGQVFTDCYCTKNRTVKHETPWRWFRRAPKRVG